MFFILFLFRFHTSKQAILNVSTKLILQCVYRGMVERGEWVNETLKPKTGETKEIIPHKNKS